MTCFEMFPEDFDDMRHALGRPKNPRAETYRNSHCADIGTPACLRLETVADRTGFWKETHRINEGRTVVFAVTQAGRDALADWVELRSER